MLASSMCGYVVKLLVMTSLMHRCAVQRIRVEVMHDMTSTTTTSQIIRNSFIVENTLPVLPSLTFFQYRLTRVKC